VRLFGSQMRATRIQARFQPLLESIPAFGQVAILALGGWLALNGNITLGTFLAFSTYVAQMLAPARQLAGMLAIAQQARAGVERIAQLLDTPPAIADAPDAVTLTDARGEIEFDDVRFGYAQDGHAAAHETLAGFTLRVAPGERVALVGASGSGKSTAAMLIPRFYDPGHGAVRVDGIDVRRLGLHSLRSQIGVVFEESFLFSDSVRANIAYGRPEASDDEIVRAARIAQADGFISALPRGYDTVVGERGLSLSGGQRQRVALARAILADPRILILDDATSAIDARTEEAIHEGLDEVMRDRSVVLIAHRQSTLNLADRVVLVEGGRVVDEGSHEELMAGNAAYRALLSGMEEDAAPPAGTSTRSRRTPRRPASRRARGAGPRRMPRPTAPARRRPPRPASARGSAAPAVAACGARSPRRPS
jgi:ATP-binding cassette subfamily B protein